MINRAVSRAMTQAVDRSKAPDGLNTDDPDALRRVARYYKEKYEAVELEVKDLVAKVAELKAQNADLLADTPRERIQPDGTQIVDGVRVMTVREYHESQDVCLATIYRWLDAGKLQGLRKGRRRYVIV